MHPVVGYVVGAGLFAVGMYGVLVRRHPIMLLLAVEVMLAGVSVIFVVTDAVRSATTGQVFVLFLVVLAAIEVGVGLAIVLRLYRQQARDPAGIELDRVDA